MKYSGNRCGWTSVWDSSGWLRGPVVLRLIVHWSLWERGSRLRRFGFRNSMRLVIIFFRLLVVFVLFLRCDIFS
jgi:hypothetical protein